MLRRRRVVLADRVEDLRAAFPMALTANFARFWRVLQRCLRPSPRPAAISNISLAKVMRPGIFVDSFGELRKHFHVLRAQVELPLRARK